MTKPSTKTRKTRTRLLDTAGKLFRSQGFHATGLDQILRRSRTPKGSLYYYFPGGKDQLAIETLQYVAGEQGQMMSAIFSAQSDPLETLQTFFAHIAENLQASDFRDGCPIAAVTLEVASDRPSVREACRQGFQTWLEVLVQHLNRAGLGEARACSQQSRTDRCMATHLYSITNRIVSEVLSRLVVRSVGLPLLSSL